MATLIPFGDKILVKRRVVGEKIGKAGIIVAPDQTKETETEIADVIYVPEHSFIDIELVQQAEAIANSMSAKAQQGDSDALIALLRYNEFIKIKSIQPGDVVMIHKYIGTSFHDKNAGGNLTLVKASDIIAVVKEIAKEKTWKTTEAKESSL